MDTSENKGVSSYHVRALYMGWCLYSLILVFIHLFELLFPLLPINPTAIGLAGLVSILAFSLFLMLCPFISEAPEASLAPLCSLCVWKAVEGSCPQIYVGWAAAVLPSLELPSDFTVIELPALRGVWKGWVFMVDMFFVICHKIIPPELFTGLNT